MQASVLKAMIEKSTVISGIGEDKKPHINGALFERHSQQTPKRVRMVSTDGGRLSTFDWICPAETSLPEGPHVLIPKKGLHEVSKFLDGNGSVQVGVYGSYFIIKHASETLAMRMMEGQYPKYSEVIFREGGHNIEIEKESLLNMLKRMSILCTDAYRAAFFTFEDNVLTINATNPDIGESKEDMAIHYSGEKMVAAFNPRFFIDALNGLNDEKIVLNIVNKEKPCIISGSADKAYFSAIMPMKI
jgi:DNA polymerase-3 subunit beta